MLPLHSTAGCHIFNQVPPSQPSAALPGAALLAECRPPSQVPPSQPSAALPADCRPPRRVPPSQPSAALPAECRHPNRIPPSQPSTALCSRYCISSRFPPFSLGAAPSLRCHPSVRWHSASSQMPSFWLISLMPDLFLSDTDLSARPLPPIRPSQVPPT